MMVTKFFVRPQNDVETFHLENASMLVQLVQEARRGNPDPQKIKAFCERFLPGRWAHVYCDALFRLPGTPEEHLPGAYIATWRAFARDLNAKVLHVQARDSGSQEMFFLAAAVARMHTEEHPVALKATIESVTALCACGPSERGREADLAHQAKYLADLVTTYFSSQRALSGKTLDYLGALAARLEGSATPVTAEQETLIAGARSLIAHHARLPSDTALTPPLPPFPSDRASSKQPTNHQLLQPQPAAPSSDAGRTRPAATATPVPPEALVAARSGDLGRSAAFRRKLKLAAEETSAAGPQYATFLNEMAVNQRPAGLASLSQPSLHLRAHVKRSAPRFVAAFGTAPQCYLLHGAPGSGKTITAHALAADLDADLWTPTGLVDKMQGESARKLQQIFAMARLHVARAGRQVVLFFDEADVLIGSRRQALGRGQGASDYIDLVNVFLTETNPPMMAGVNQGITVVAATNHDEHVDTAVNDRFTTVELQPPSHDNLRTDLLSRLAGPHGSQIHHIAAAHLDAFVGALAGAQSYRLVGRAIDCAKAFAVDEDRDRILLADLVNGFNELREVKRGELPMIHLDDLLTAPGEA